MAGNKFIFLTVGICASNVTMKIKMLFHLNIIQKKAWNESMYLSLFLKAFITTEFFFRNMTDELPWKLYYAAGIRGNISTISVIEMCVWFVYIASLTVHSVLFNMNKFIIMQTDSVPASLKSVCLYSWRWYTDFTQ